MYAELVTPRLLLQAIAPSEIDPLHQFFNDPFVRKYLCDDQLLPRAQVAEMITTNSSLFQEKQFGLWWIKLKAEAKIIGIVGLWYFFEEEQPQLLYALLPTATSQGYATEAASRIVDYGFHQLGYAYLLASADAFNIASHKVAERLGMTKIAEKMISDRQLFFFRLEP